VREARLVGDADRRAEKVAALREEFTGSALRIPAVAIELLWLIRDYVGWDDTLAFVDSLPEAMKQLAVIREQRLLALGNGGRPEEAIARLEELVKDYGDSPERQGLIGGRYKRLWRAARAARVERGEAKASPDESRCLEKAIDHYSRGMRLDYNEYYCSSNLPQLLRDRGRRGDEERARVIDHFVIAACERALERGEGDEWLRPTLLGAAFRAGDVDKARELALVVGVEGGARWKLDSTVEDLEHTAARTGDPAAREALTEIVGQLRPLV
jgi:hypothetical protein